MRILSGQDLMQGSDHEFLVNLYRHVLLRGPDESGYRHHRDVLEANPECRRSLIEGFAASTEAQRLGVAIHVIWDDAAAPAAPGTAPQALVATLRETLGTLDAEALAALEAPLAECLEALRRQLSKQGA